MEYNTPHLVQCILGNHHQPPSPANSKPPHCHLHHFTAPPLPPFHPHHHHHHHHVTTTTTSTLSSDVPPTPSPLPQNLAMVAISPEGRVAERHRPPLCPLLHVEASLGEFGDLVVWFLVVGVLVAMVVWGLVWVVGDWEWWMEDVEGDRDGIFMEYSFFGNNYYLYGLD